MSDEDLAELFLTEARAILDALGEALLALEREGAGGEAQGEAFRLFHTLKGMANMEGLPELTRLCHEAESSLVPGERPSVDALLEAHDRAAALLEAWPSHGPGEGAETAFVPVNVARLDDLLNLSGELAVATTRLAYERGAREGGPSEETIARISALVRSLQDEVMRIRLLPARTLFSGLPRLVRDAAHAQGKDARLDIEDADIGMDRAIVERMTGILAHLVQNAVVHGIEAPEERLRVGKPREGRIHLRAFRDNETLVFVIEDDGRGVDVPAVVRRAVERGLVPAGEAETLAPAAATELLFRPGFSTAERAGDHAGRGIGLTAARDAVRSLGGALALDSRPGRSTRVVIRLPPTVALLDTLVAQAHGSTIALPLRSVRRILPLSVSLDVAGRRTLFHEGQALPVFAVDGRAAERAEAGFIVVAEGARGRFGLVVDRLVGTHSAILKPLESSSLESDASAMGAAVLGSGVLAIVLDLNAFPGVA